MQNNIYKDLGEYLIFQILKKFKIVQYNRNQIVYSENDRNASRFKMYLINKGEIQVSK